MNHSENGQQMHDSWLRLMYAIHGVSLSTREKRNIIQIVKCSINIDTSWLNFQFFFFKIEFIKILKEKALVRVSKGELLG